MSQNQNKGLSSQQVLEISKNSKKNIIEHNESSSPLKILAAQFASPLIFILIIAGAITFLLQEYVDTAVILGSILINAFLGFYQENKAQDALNNLKKMLSPKAVVLRDGKKEIINVEDIVVGDYVFLSSDYNIPADGNLIKEKNLSVSEAMLTGESIPVHKNVEDKVFMGTTVASGSGEMIVEKIGSDTEMGKIGVEVASLAEQKTPLQDQISQLAKWIGVLVIVICAALIILGILLNYDPVEIFTSSVAIAVAAVPEGLAVSLTVILAIGMQKILKKNSIVRKLLAAETLGSVSVICTDKTGTITEGKFSVVEDEFVDKKIGEIAAFVGNNQIDPMEVAMYEWSKEKIGMKSSFDEIIKEYKRIDEIPFESENKFSATLHSSSNGKIAFVFGAPEVILSKSKLKDKKEWEQKINTYAANGYRILGFAYKSVVQDKKDLKIEDIKDLQWNGFLVYDDPIRKGIKETFDLCKTAGIKVKMITGDYKFTAENIARKVGLIDENDNLDKVIISGDELEKLSDEELVKKISRIKVFARINPIQKLKIVTVLNKIGEVVAMTGDGINDAPALKKADIGIVVNEASDVSKGTADIVLLDSNFSTIVFAVEEGRVIFANIRKVIMYLLGDSFCELTLISIAILAGLPIPFTAAQVLWINLIEDSLPALSLAFQKKENDVMKRKPRNKNENILGGRLIGIISSFIFTNVILILGLFIYFRSTVEDIETLRTITFVALGVNSLFYIFSCKSIRKPLLTYNPFDNKYLNLSVVLGLVLLVIAVYFPPLQYILETRPLNIEMWIILIIFGFLNIIFVEIIKFIINSLRDRMPNNYV